jgi:transposase
VITVPAGIRVLVATKPVDFRRGADSLAAVVREQLKHDPFCGTIYIFRSKRADRLKIVAWDGSGLVLFWSRRRGRFCRAKKRKAPHEAGPVVHEAYGWCRGGGGDARSDCLPNHPLIFWTKLSARLHARVGPWQNSARIGGTRGLRCWLGGNHGHCRTVKLVFRD